MRNKGKLKVIPLGGLHEIGKNLTVFEYDKDIIIVDCGIAFPEDEMLGIDLVIPDFSYLLGKKENIRGIVLTHGHEDHIGALPYFLKEINAPIYGTRLTLGLVNLKLEEHKINNTDIITVKAGDKITLGCFNIEFINSTHSIADTVALAIDTPIGLIFHTADFKIDYTPIESSPIDLARIAEIGSKGVLLLMSDSTNADNPGYTMSERTVGQSLENIFRTTKERIIIATFASNIHRIQQIINAAGLFERKVAVCGRSLINVIKTAKELGYLTVNEKDMIPIEKIGNYPKEKIVLISTGTQGEPMSALTRIASSTHRYVEIIKGDTVIISANPIPGNEKFVWKVINDLIKQGAEVIYEALADVHVSGHACREELKLIYSLVKPKYFIPVHGEYRHLKAHKDLVCEMGLEKENCFILKNGSVFEITKKEAVESGEVTAGNVLIDGLGVGDVGNIVLRDRRHLSQDGLIVVVLIIDKETGEIISGPEIISRGFVYVKESYDLIEKIKKKAVEAVLANQNSRQKEKYAKMKKESDALKYAIKDSLKHFLYEETKRHPMILPIIILGQY